MAFYPTSAVGHHVASKDQSINQSRPAFGFIIIGGAIVGGAFYHLYIANELFKRGYPVHIFWAVESIPYAKIDAQIPQHWLFVASRYNGIVQNLFNLKYSVIDEYLGKIVANILHPQVKLKLYQRNEGLCSVSWAMQGLIRHICHEIDSDKGVLKSFAKKIRRYGITHLIQVFLFLAPSVLPCSPI